MVHPSELAVNPHPKISKSDNPIQRCIIQAVSVADLIVFVCYPHDLALGVVEGQLPLLGPVVELVEVRLEDITITQASNCPRNCTIICKEAN